MDLIVWDVDWSDGKGRVDVWMLQEVGEEV